MSANMPVNSISLAIPDDDMQAIREALQTLQDKLEPHLVDLDAAGRRGLPKMGAKTVDFVSKTLTYTRANMAYRPGFVDLDEFTRDLNAIGVLRELQGPLDRLSDMVEDSLLLSGSEAYAAALACYQAFKSAAKLGHPGAEKIAEDLSARFVKRNAKPASASAAANARVERPAAEA